MDRDSNEWQRPWTLEDAQASASIGLPPGSTIERMPTPGALPPDPEPPRGSGGLHRSRGIAVPLIAALIGAVLGTATTMAVLDDEPAATVAAPSVGGPAVQAPTIDVGDVEGLNIVSAVAKAVTPSVVRIDILGGGADGEQQEIGLGSGVIYRSDGYIITNNHVVESAENLRVRLSDRREFPAEVVGTDALNDLAVLRIDADSLPAVNIRMDPPVVGETAIAIGSPFGLDASVTAGVVSAVARDIQVPGDGRATVIPSVIQTDAAINPGNSGGALVDAQGRLLGINSAILTTTGGSQGVGFAIPVEQAVTSADQLIATGVVRHAFLGVSGSDLQASDVERLGLDGPDGALIEEVTSGSGAFDAGLRTDDVVVRVEDAVVTSMSELVVAVRRFQPGDAISIVYIRDGEQQTTTVTLGERPEGQ